MGNRYHLTELKAPSKVPKLIHANIQYSVTLNTKVNQQLKPKPSKTRTISIA